MGAKRFGVDAGGGGVRFTVRGMIVADRRRVSASDGKLTVLWYPAAGYDPTGANR
jgi:hypothetical protein